MVFSAKGLLLNREGAKDAKRDGCWFVLILEERSESEQTKPFGRGGEASFLLTSDFGSLISGSRAFFRRPRMALWPVQGYLSSSWRSFTKPALKGFRWM